MFYFKAFTKQTLNTKVNEAQIVNTVVVLSRGSTLWDECRFFFSSFDFYEVLATQYK